MMDALLHAGQRLADALAAENAALQRLDLSGAAPLARTKQQASDAFAAAFTATTRTGMSSDQAVKASTAELTRRLQSLSVENRRLLERAIAIQAQVIESIAGAALPRAGNGAYGAGGRLQAPRLPPAFALASRA
jgi:ABC-type transporter Mla subunit MlaD